MTNSQDETSTKCFSSILRRLLCTGSLPTHPAIELNSTDLTRIPNKAESNKLTQTPPTPNIVARLMGLDSFPPTDSNSLSKQTRTLGSILRSRSVNYVDYLPQFELTKVQLHDSDHRRVRTSVSFREVPTFLNAQNHEFFLLCFDEAGKARKSEVGFLAEKEEKVERSSYDRESGNDKERVSLKKKREKQKKEEERETRVSAIIKPPPPTPKVGSVVRQVKDSSKEPSVKGKREVLRVQAKCRRKKSEKSINSKNNSIGSGCNSLYDLHDEYPVQKKKYSSRSRKNNHRCPKIVTVDTKRANKLALNTRESTDDSFQMLMEVCKLAEEDTKGFVRIAKQVFNFGDFEEICFDFGEEILQVLLCQVVDELCVGSSLE